MFTSTSPTIRCQPLYPQVGQLAGLQAALDDTNQRLFELRVEVRWCCACCVSFVLSHL